MPPYLSPSPRAAPVRAQREFRAYTRAEVAAHCHPDDLWLIMRSRDDGRLTVYDLTEYVETHPGGEAILTNAGADSTPGFNGPQHPPTVHDLVREYKIGYVEEEEEQRTEEGGAPPDATPATAEEKKTA